MSNRLTLIRSSIARGRRLRKLNESFKEIRNKLPDEVWWKISRDWHEAFNDNNETDIEMEVKLA